MTPAPGTRLGPYEILSPQGAGGMGEVYRARDARLGREVAIKVLPPSVALDSDARARFEREARAISQLHHPHICTLYDVGLEGEVAYLVMELIEGETIAQRLTRGSLSIEETLNYGAQVAEALAHAHARGVIHRDLKPSNVILGRDGRAKVLDFGLATFVPSGVGDGRSEVTVMAATTTEAGAIVGTPHYLAPEILRGGRADVQSDVWALGALLYEMVSAQKPFTGRTAPELTAAILHETPAPLPSRVPPGLTGLIAHCIAKDRAQRVETAAEVRAALDALRGGAMLPDTTRSGRRPGWKKLAVSVFVAAAFASLVVKLVIQEPERPKDLKQRQLTSNPPENMVLYGVISPDGKTLAVLDQKSLSLRSIETGESHSIPLPEDYARVRVVFPVLSWAPDGSRFLLSGISTDKAPSTWSVPVLGGGPRKVLSSGYMTSFSPDGSHIAYIRQGVPGAAIWLAGPNGEEPRRVVTSDSAGQITTWPTWSPSGKRLAYGRFVARAGKYETFIETCDLQGGHRQRALTSSRLHFYSVSCWLSDGRMLFGLSELGSSLGDVNLWWLRVDPKSGIASGEPRRISQWQRLALVVPTGASADGKKLSVGVLEYQSDVYVGRVSGGEPMLRDVRRLTSDQRFDVQPTWLADGKGILFASDRNGTWDIFRQRLDSDDAEPAVAGPGDQTDPRLSPDGKWILYYSRLEAAGSGSRLPYGQIMRAPVGGGAPEKVLDVQQATGFRCARAPSNLCVLDEVENGTAVFVAFDPVRGRLGELARIATGPTGVLAWDLAPDASALAVLVSESDSVATVEIQSLRDKSLRTVRLDRPFRLASVAWTANGTGLLAVGRSEEDGWRLVRISLDGKVTMLTPQQLWMYSAENSPDGRSIAFTSNTGQGNIWLLEDF